MENSQLAWHRQAPIQTSTVSDNCPILHSITSIFMTGRNSHAFEKIATQGKNLPGFVLADSRRLHGDRTSLAQAIDIPISDLITLNNSA